MSSENSDYSVINETGESPDNSPIDPSAPNTQQSGPSEELTDRVLREMWGQKKASTGEIAESIGYSQEQTKKALDFLKEIDVVSQEKFTRQKAWILEEDRLTKRITDAIEKELNSVELRERYLMKQNLKKFGKDSRTSRLADEEGEPEPPSLVENLNNPT